MATFPLTPSPQFNWGTDSGNLAGARQFQRLIVSGPAINFSKIVPDATGLIPLKQGPTRAIWADVAGTITGHDAYGNVVTTFPLVAGWNSISLAGVTSIATTAQVWGIW